MKVKPVALHGAERQERASDVSSTARLRTGGWISAEPQVLLEEETLPFQAALGISGDTGCMAPQSCVMNPAQGSPPSAMTSPAEHRTTEQLELSPVRTCKPRSLDLPFGVESLISKRTPSASLQSPEPGSDCGRAEDKDCGSPSGLYRSTAEALGPGDKESSSWFQASYGSPPSESPLQRISDFTVILFKEMYCVL